MEERGVELRGVEERMKVKEEFEMETKLERQRLVKKTGWYTMEMIYGMVYYGDDIRNGILWR